MDANSINEAVDKTAGMSPAKLLNKVFIVFIGVLMAALVFVTLRLLDEIDKANARTEQSEAERKAAIKMVIDCYNSKTEDSKERTEWMRQQRMNYEKYN